MALRFHLDENVSAAVAEGLRRRGIDVMTAGEGRLLGASDLAHLEHCRAAGRILFTQDSDFLILASSGIPHRGIVFSANGTRSIRQMIETLILIDACLYAEDMNNHIEYI
jgi:predicted nuclease of predicted toxin-antitoxin system